MPRGVVMTHDGWVPRATQDPEFSYKPFMPVLGQGLIVSQGELWKTQRLLLSSAFRIEILDDTAVRGMGV